MLDKLNLQEKRLRKQKQTKTHNPWSNKNISFCETKKKLLTQTILEIIFRCES